MNIDVSTRGWLYNTVYWNRDHKPKNTSLCLFCQDAFVGILLFLLLCGAAVLVTISLGSKTVWYFLMEGLRPQGVKGFWYQSYKPIHFWPKRKGKNIPPLFFLLGLLILCMWSVIAYGYFKVNHGATNLFGSTELAAFFSEDWVRLTRFTTDVWAFVQEHWLAILLSVVLIGCLLTIRQIIAALAIPYAFVAGKITHVLKSSRWQSFSTTLLAFFKSAKQKLCPTITFVP